MTSFATGGAETLVNTTTADHQTDPWVTALSGGGWVVTWTSRNQDGSGDGVYQQRYDASGVAAGIETRVNSTTLDQQVDPSGAGLTDGGWVVVWTSVAQGGSGPGVYQQRYDLSGAAVGVETLVSTTYQGDASVTALGDGGWVVVWAPYDGSGQGVFQQRYDSSGAAVGVQTLVNTTTSNGQYNPTCSALTDGGWVVAWTSDGQDGGSGGIYQQRYGSNGFASGGETQVNTSTATDQRFQSITALADGGWVVAWTSFNQDGDNGGIYQQRYGSNGVAIGGEVRVNSTTASDQETPSIAALTDGGWVVTWMSYSQDGESYGVYQQRYDSTGATRGEETRANVTTAGGQWNPSIIGLSTGDWVVTWISPGQDGSGDGIYQRHFTNDVSGDTDDNTITGSSWGEVIYGLGGDDSITALGGDDTLDGGTGDDTLIGGDGNDTYVMDSVDDVVTEAGTGTDTVATSVSYTLGANIENLTLTGSANLTGTGNGLGNVITGNSGDNTLDGGIGDDTLIGLGGNDTYILDSTNDVVIEADGGGHDLVQSAVDTTLSAYVEDLTLTGTGDIDGTGNDLANTITGNSGANSLSGGGDNDSLVGNGGNDTLDGGTGNDTMDGGAGNDLYIVDSSSDVIAADLSGTDTVEASASFSFEGNETLEVLTLTGSSNLSGNGNGLANRMTGNGGANFLFGAGANDTLIGNGGQDTLDGGDGNDSLVGGVDNDTYVVDNANDIIAADGGGFDWVYATFSYSIATRSDLDAIWLMGTDNFDATGNSGGNNLYGNEGNNRLSGGGGTDYILGLGGADTLEGGSGANTLEGGDGDDELRSVAGAEDWLIGGDGVDFASVDRAGRSASFIVDIADPTLTSFFGASQLNGVERIDFTAGSGNDQITGGDLDDRVIGNAGRDLIAGGGGADTLDGGAGVDIITGDDGNDSITGGTGIDMLSGDAGLDTVRGGDGADVIDGGDDNDQLFGDKGNDNLDGGSGNDTLNGGAGIDVLAGGTGDDTYIVDNVRDAIFEDLDEGTDLVQSSVGYSLDDNIENLTLTGSSVINGIGNELGNVLSGNSAKNRLLGQAGDDTLSGNNGDDTLNGGEGSDSLDGGAGKDIFVFDAALGVSNIDTITGFVAVDDTIQLENAIFTKLTKTGVLASAAFYASASGKAHDADDRIIYETDTGKLFYDADGKGSGAAIQIAVLTGLPTLTAADFVII